MRTIRLGIVAAVVGLGLGVAIVGCSAPAPAAKDKMGDNKMGDKMKDKPGS